jgi:hypothetical protein
MDSDTLLLEIMLYPAMSQPSGIRVYENGLYRYMQGSEGWSDVWTFTGEEMAVLRQAIDTADIPSLESQYEANGMVSDGVTTIWKVTVNGQQYEISLAPGAQSPALDKLFLAFSTLRKLSPEHSNWHVWQPDGTYRDFTVVGSVNAVEDLRGLVHALFIPQPEVALQEPVPPPNTLLVKTDWVTESETEITELYADGSYTRTVDGEMKEEKKLPIAQVRSVIHNIHEIDWSVIPDYINTM